MNDFSWGTLSFDAAGLVGVVFLTGLFAGSFFNVCIYRLPRKIPIVFSRSKCPFCQKNLGLGDLMPVVGYFLRQGKCHYCKRPISHQYPLVELLSGFFFWWCYTKYNFSAHFLKAAVFASFLMVIAFIDMNHRLIFDKVLIWLGMCGILFNIYAGYTDWADFLIAAALGGGFLYLIALMTGGAMGLGDAKMACAIGLWLGVKFTVAALFLAFLTGSAVALALIFTGRKSRKDFMPFAPFIAAGAFLSMMYGDVIISWYLTVVGIR